MFRSLAQTNRDLIAQQKQRDTFRGLAVEIVGAENDFERPPAPDQMWKLSLATEIEVIDDQTAE